MKPYPDPDPPFPVDPNFIPPNYAPLHRLRRDLKVLFPEDVGAADLSFQDLYEGLPLGGLWMEMFVRRTAAAIRRRDEATVLAHFSILSKRLQRDGSLIRNVIDVNYMEQLLHMPDGRSQHWVWSRIPLNLKQLWVDFWGDITPGRLDRLEAGWPRKASAKPAPPAN